LIAPILLCFLGIFETGITLGVLVGLDVFNTVATAFMGFLATTASVVDFVGVVSVIFGGVANPGAFNPTPSDAGTFFVGVATTLAFHPGGRIALGCRGEIRVPA
jgi:hypothetical protein